MNTDDLYGALSAQITASALEHETNNWPAYFEGVRGPDHLRLVELQYITEHPVNGELLIKVTKAGHDALMTRSDTT
jgi:hypothetical protein